MKARRSFTDYLQDIIENALLAESFLKDKSDIKEFKRDTKTVMATVRALEVIGEAAKNISKRIQEKYPNVPWRGMSGMRDKVVHDYFGVDAEVIWRTVKEDLPRLREQINKLIADMQKD